jgi:hypothetical protein
MDISVGIGNGIDIASQMKVKMRMARPPQRKRRPQYIIYGRKRKEGLPSQILEPSSRLIIIIYILKNEVRCLVDATTTGLGWRIGQCLCLILGLTGSKKRR